MQDTLTIDQLVAKLATISTQPVTIVTLTRPSMKVRDNPYVDRGVVRRARRNGFIGPDYESVVNRQRLRESRSGDDRQFPLFKASKLWNGRGRRVKSNRHLVEHTVSGELYLVFFPQRVLDSRYEYADTGRKIPDRRITPWLRSSKPKPSPHQGTKKPIAWQCIRLDSLLSITISGTEYLLGQS